MSKGSPRVTFVIGVLLTLRASYLAGLDRIHNQNLSTTETVLVVVGFNIVMLWLLEVPLVCFLVAPDWTPGAIERAKLWVGRHSHTFAVRGLSIIGALLVIKGVAGLLERHRPRPLGGAPRHEVTVAALQRQPDTVRSRPRAVRRAAHARSRHGDDGGDRDQRAEAGSIGGSRTSHGLGQPAGQRGGQEVSPRLGGFGGWVTRAVPS